MQKFATEFKREMATTHKWSALELKNCRILFCNSHLLWKLHSLCGRHDWVHNYWSCKLWTFELNDSHECDTKDVHLRRMKKKAIWSNQQRKTKTKIYMYIVIARWVVSTPHTISFLFYLDFFLSVVFFFAENVLYFVFIFSFDFNFIPSIQNTFHKLRLNIESC